MNVQIVDDDAELAELLREQLRLAGHDARAWSSDFGLLLHERPWRDVDGAVVDLWLERHGWDEDFPRAVAILGWLEKNRPDIRRVVYSAIDERNLTTAQRSHIDGLADVYLRKPASTKSLLGALRG